MTVGTHQQPDFETQDASTYKGNIDNSIMATANAAQFSVHEADTPAMSVVVDAGFILTGDGVVSVAQTTLSSITAPATNPRIDLVAMNSETGTLSVETGTEDASPVAPTLPDKSIPLATISLLTSTSSIANIDITDERPLFNQSGSAEFEPIASIDITDGDATIEFKDYFDDTKFNDYITEFKDVTVNAAIAYTNLRGNVSTDGIVYLDGSSGYLNRQDINSTDSDSLTLSAATSHRFYFQQELRVTDDNHTLNGEIRFRNMDSSTIYPTYTAILDTWTDKSGSLVKGIGTCTGAFVGNTNAVQWLKFLLSGSDTFRSGTVILKGRRI